MSNTNMDLMTFLESSDRKLIRVCEVASILGVSLETIYDWKYRAEVRNVPGEMFVKIGRMLFVRTDILREWIEQRMR